MEDFSFTGSNWDLVNKPSMEMGGKEKPAYTKEMHEAGELPPVGSECMIKHKDATEEWAQPDFKKAKITAFGEELFIQRNDHTCNGLHESVGVIKDYIFKPIDIRTDEEKLIYESKSMLEFIMRGHSIPRRKATEMIDEIIANGFLIGKPYNEEAASRAKGGTIKPGAIYHCMEPLK